MPEERLIALEQKVEQIYTSVEQTRKYLLWTMVVTLAVVVLPAIGLVFAIPSFLSTYNDTIQNLDLQGLQ